MCKSYDYIYGTLVNNDVWVDLKSVETEKSYKRVLEDQSHMKNMQNTELN